MTASVNQRVLEQIPMPAIAPRSAAGGRARKLPARCPSCGLWDVCVPCELALTDTEQTTEPIINRRRVTRGDCLYRAGDVFRSLYTVRSGFFKTVQGLEDGRDQITGFQMAGEMLGLDGIEPEVHACNAVALEDSEVCVILYSLLVNLGRTRLGLQRQFHMAMSREIVREHGLMMLLGTMNSEERVSVFLLNLAQRFKARGYSPEDFILRMNREEIGSYLGMKVETVSRMLSRFQDEGLIEVQQKHIRIRDAAGLKQCMGRRPNS